MSHKFIHLHDITPEQTTSAFFSEAFKFLKFSTKKKSREFIFGLRRFELAQQLPQILLSLGKVLLIKLNFIRVVHVNFTFPEMSAVRN